MNFERLKHSEQKIERSGKDPKEAFREAINKAKKKKKTGKTPPTYAEN